MAEVGSKQEVTRVTGITKALFQVEAMPEVLELRGFKYEEGKLVGRITCELVDGVGVEVTQTITERLSRYKRRSRRS